MALNDAAWEESLMPGAQRVSMVSEVWSFLRVRKKWWLGPVVFVLLTFGVAFAMAFPLFLLVRERRLAAGPV